MACRIDSKGLNGPIVRTAAGISKQINLELLHSIDFGSKMLVDKSMHLPIPEQQIRYSTGQATLIFPKMLATFSQRRY
jgi:hypothetical protein